MGATLGIIGALLGAGGSIGGSALQGSQASGESSEARRRARSSASNITSEVNPLNNPLIASVVAQNLARMGIADPTLLAGSGPLGRFKEAIRASGLTGQEQFGVFALLNDTLRDLREGRITMEDVEDQVSQDISFQFIRQFNPFDTLGELLQAEQQFQESTSALNDELGRIAALATERQGTIDEALAALTSSAAQGSDFDALLSQSRDALERDFADSRQAALSAANFGGFNPAGTLERLEDARRDLDLLAIERAAGLANARTGSLVNVAALLSSLDPSLRAEGASSAALAPSVAAISQVGQPAIGPTSGVGQGLSDLGGALSVLSLDSLLNRQGGSTGGTAPGTSNIGDLSNFGSFPAGVFGT